MSHGLYNVPTSWKKRANRWRLSKRAARRAGSSPKSATHHDMTEKFAEDKSTTRAVRFRQQRAWWWLQGKSAPPMDADGRPLD